MAVQMQARSATNGQLYTWVASGADFAAAGYPGPVGPGDALDVAISMRPSTSSSSGLVVSGSPSAGWTPTWNGVGAVWAPKDAYDITSFVHANLLYEVGTVLSNPAFTAAHSQTPDTLLLTNNQNSESKDVHATPTSFTSSQSYTFATPSYTVTWTLTGTKITSDVATRTASAAQKSFWGVSASPAATEAFIEALANSALDTDAARTFTQSPGTSEYICFAHPTRYGTPTFLIGGTLPGGYISLGTTISVTNAQGYAENYTLWRSVTAGLAANTSTTVQN